MLSLPFLGTISASNYLVSISANGDQVLVGAFLSLIGAFTCAGIAISLYPVLRRYNEGLALGAVGFRLIEAVMYIVGVVGLVLLLALSQQFVKAGAPDTSFFQTLGAMALAGYHWAAYVGGPIAFSLGALMYYRVFYQTRLVPRWLSAWGLAGASLCLVASTLVMFGVIGAVSPLRIILNLPGIGAQEMVLAGWLILRGFNSPATGYEQPRQMSAYGR